MKLFAILPLRFRRILGSLLAVVVAFWTYRLVAVPLIEPKIKAPLPTAAGASAGGGRGQPADLQEEQVRELARWFKPDDWPLRKRPKILENSRGKLLLDEYKTLPDGRVRVQPCVMIFLPERDSMPEEERLRQAVILEAPAGAVLQFDQPFELTRGSIGRLVAGQLEGEITIRSDYRQPGPADDLFIKTRDVDLGQELITTASPIEFRFGNTRGNGREMRIELIPDGGSGGSRYGPQVSGVKSFTLSRNVKIRTMFEGNSAEPSAPRRPSLPMPFETPSNQQTPVEVSCRGPFHFDLEKQYCTFESHVDVLRLRRNAPADHLACQSLAIFFTSAAPPQADASVAGGKKENPGLSKLQAQRIEARGDPVTITSTVDQLTATCQTLNYEVATQQISLRSATSDVVVERADKHLVAREVHYEPGQAGAIGRLLAVGPGELTGELPDNPGQRFQVRWQKELRSRPHETEQLVSVVQNGFVRSPGTGSLAAEQIHLWFKDNRSGRPAGDANADGVTPRRLLAQGKVRFETPQLVGTTDKLETWFSQAEERTAGAVLRRLSRPEEPMQARPVIPVQYRQVAQNPPPAGDDPPAAAPLPDAKGGMLGLTSAGQKFEVSGRLLQIQVQLVDRVSELKEAIVLGMARFAEVETPVAGEKPLLVEGDRLHVVRKSEEACAMAVSGKPARVDGRGMTLNADLIHLDQSTNKLWTGVDPKTGEGPGILTLLVDEQREGGKGGPQPLTVTWRKSMAFDGQSALFKGHVEAQRPEQRMKTDSLEVTFDRRIDFIDPRQAHRPQVENVRCRNGVEATMRTVDERGLMAVERMRVANLAINQISGEMAADGPGWLSRVTRGPPAPEATIPDLNGGAADKARLPAEDQLTYLFVRFQKTVTGNLHRQQARFDGQVKAVYGPVDAWDASINPDAPGGLGPTSALLNCDHMDVIQMPAVGNAKAHLELDAVGNAFVEGQTYTAHAGRISYNQAKDLMVLQGEGRALAELAQQERVGGPVKTLTANKIRYWKTDKHVEVDDARFLDLGQVPQGKPGGRK